MFAVYAESFSSDDPLSGLVVGERPDPEVPDGWTTVDGQGVRRSTTTTSGRCAGSGCARRRCR